MPERAGYTGGVNIHPLFVHFPIGLLATYSLLELAAFFVSPVRRESWLFSVKAFLLFTGTLFSFLAIVTGGMAEDLISGSNPRAYIIEVHEPVAISATLAYVVLAAAYLVRMFDQMGWGNRMVGVNRLFIWIWNVKRSVSDAILDSWFLPLLAFIGLMLITIAGALGAAIVYGHDIDPFVSFIYHLFWVY